MKIAKKVAQGHQLEQWFLTVALPVLYPAPLTTCL